LTKPVYTEAIEPVTLGEMHKYGSRLWKTWIMRRRVN